MKIKNLFYTLMLITVIAPSLSFGQRRARRPKWGATQTNLEKQAVALARQAFPTNVTLDQLTKLHDQKRGEIQGIINQLRDYPTAQGRVRQVMNTLDQVRNRARNTIVAAAAAAAQEAGRRAALARVQLVPPPPPAEARQPLAPPPPLTLFNPAQFNIFVTDLIAVEYDPTAQVSLIGRAYRAFTNVFRQAFGQIPVEGQLSERGIKELRQWAYNNSDNVINAINEMENLIYIKQQEMSTATAEAERKELDKLLKGLRVTISHLRVLRDELRLGGGPSGTNGGGVSRRRPSVVTPTPRAQVVSVTPVPSAPAPPTDTNNGNAETHIGRSEAVMGFQIATTI